MSRRVVVRLGLAAVAVGGLSIAASTLPSDGARSAAPAVVASAKSAFERAMADSQRATGPSVRGLGGGADHFAYRSVEATSSTRVVLVATVRTWSRVAQVRPTDGRTLVATPSNVIDVRAVVEQGAGGAWKVTSLTWSFQPGSGP